MYLYQKKILEMINSLPEGAQIRTALVSHGKHRTYAVKDGKIYLFKNGEWASK